MPTDISILIGGGAVVSDTFSFDDSLTLHCQTEVCSKTLDLKCIDCTLCGSGTITCGGTNCDLSDYSSSPSFTYNFDVDVTGTLYTLTVDEANINYQCYITATTGGDTK